jgi:hypothetical protein
MISLEFQRPEFFADKVRSFMPGRFLHLIVFALLLSWLSSSALPQQTSGTQSSNSQVAVSDKTGKDAVCDGALEIIPSGTTTFTRKRYIAANPKAKSKLAKPRSNVRR